MKNRPKDLSLLLVKQNISCQRWRREIKRQLNIFIILNQRNRVLSRIPSKTVWAPLRFRSTAIMLNLILHNPLSNLENEFVNYNSQSRSYPTKVLTNLHLYEQPKNLIFFSVRHLKWKCPPFLYQHLQLIYY